MIERRELEKLKEVIEYSMPQIVDYNPRSGRYSIELAMTKHIDLGEGDHHICPRISEKRNNISVYCFK